MCEVVLRKVRTEQIKRYDVRICDPFWGFETPFAYKRCHGLMAIIANTGNENFSIKIDVLEKDMHIYTTEEHRMGIRYTVNTGSPVLQYNVSREPRKRRPTRCRFPCRVDSAGPVSPTCN